MKLFGLHFSAVWMLCCCLVYGRGDGVCTQGKLITRINLTTQLQSEILLPCLFEPALTGSNLSTDCDAEWTQINETIVYIVAIKVNGQINFWNQRHNRINAFREAAASGNFSILIRNVQLSDLGLYHCQLFRYINCSLGYKEIQLSLAAVEFSLLNNWQLIAAAGGGGGFLLLCLITVCVYYTRTKRQTIDVSINHRSHNCPDVDGQKVEETDEITYASVCVKSRNCHDNKDPISGSASASVLQNPETVIYASVKQRDKR